MVQRFSSFILLFVVLVNTLLVSIGASFSTEALAAMGSEEVAATSALQAASTDMPISVQVPLSNCPDDDCKDPFQQCFHCHCGHCSVMIHTVSKLCVPLQANPLWDSPEVIYVGVDLSGLVRPPSA
jgi:hypothetical protein